MALERKRLEAKTDRELLLLCRQRGLIGIRKRPQKAEMVNMLLDWQKEQDRKAKRAVKKKEKAEEKAKKEIDDAVDKVVKRYGGVPKKLGESKDEGDEGRG